MPVPLPVMMPKKAEIIFLKMAAENRNFRIIIGNQLSEILPQVDVKPILL